MLLPKRKDDLKILREKLLGYEQEQKIKPILLNDKVDEFINWYSKNYTDIGEYLEPKKMRDFIEKMAVWYELRYPDYEVNRLMPISNQEIININDVMFKNNKYTKTLLEEDSDIKELDWAEFYNTKAFVNSLPWRERCLLASPRYQDIVYWNHSNAHLYLTKKGRIAKAVKMEAVFPGISDKSLEKKHIKELVQIIKEKNIKVPSENEFENAIKNYDNQVYQKEEMLNCVMYRIIERGGNRIGPRRAFLFAKEFGRNIDIPMIYGVDRSDPGLRLFMNEYIKSGGSKDLVCYIGYFLRDSKYERINTITIQELIKTQNNNAKKFYTSEEDELHQRMVNALALASQIDIDQPKNEVKQLRLQKRLEKSKNNLKVMNY